MSLVSPWSIQCHLKYQSMLFEQTPTSVIIFMMSDIVCNGNIVMKEITLNFKEQLWELKIRGRIVVLEDLDITNTFYCTTSNLHEIFEIVHKIKICTEIDTEHKTKVPIHIIWERIAERGDENTQNFKMRSKTCKQVVGWSYTGDSCHTCINNLNAFKNEETDLIDLNKVDEDDLKKILKQVFPGA
ncbi:unnamed protein product [Mytilus coruscus]|uniref:Uncharacterized protein n=1 Tax=Mytilus coruscus TaxID=42192 RepID=A0A6J7ZY41_MYTCO|nr:unnamed protein product [Mytilus coruscus]